MKISVKKEEYGSNPFAGDEYVIDLGRRFEGYEPGDLVCRVDPFFINLPLTLEIAIRRDGSFVFRSWKFHGRLGTPELQTSEKAEGDPELESWETPFVATPEQIDTVSGLFSGRIRFEGLRLDPGVTVQKICPIDVKKEEERIGKHIYLNC